MSAGLRASAPVSPSVSQPVSPPVMPIDVRLVRERVRELPALPQAVMNALTMLRSDSAGVGDCAERISVDAAMTAHTLRLANSAFYGMSGRVATLPDAIHLLGRQTLAALMTTVAVMHQPGLGGGDQLHTRVFWRHALAAALAAQTLAAERGIDQDLAFTAGLLHDIGALALATHFPAEYQAVSVAMLAEDRPRREVEQRLLGLDHALVGALVARHWHLPATVIAAIGAHHRPEAAAHGVPAESVVGTLFDAELPSDVPGDDAADGDDGPATLADIVHVADALAHALDLSHLPDEAVPRLDPGAWQRIDLSPAQGLRVLAHTESGVSALCLALSI